MQSPKVTADRAFNGFGTNFEGSPEPLYGSVFLPRKFKVAITVPGDNSVDLFTNDVGIVVMSDDAGEIQGYNIVVGGGMGRTARWVVIVPYFFRQIDVDHYLHLLIVAIFIALRCQVMTEAIIAPYSEI